MKEGNYGIDLLRIVSMFMIVILHVLRHGGVLEAGEILSVNYEPAWILELAAFCAVSVYALISGYVGIGTEFRYSRIISL